MIHKCSICGFYFDSLELYLNLGLYYCKRCLLKELKGGLSNESKKTSKKKFRSEI